MKTKFSCRKNLRSNLLEVYNPNKYNCFSQLEKNKNSKCNQNDLHKPVLFEKIISFSCYFSFGLTGLLWILANVFSDNIISKFTFFHIFQSLVFGVMTSIVAFVIANLTYLSGLMFNNIYQYEVFYNIVYSNLSLIVFCIASVFGILALLGKNIYLPGIKKLVFAFVK